jgi:hypothetical protein
MGKGYAFIGAYVPAFSGVGTMLFGLGLPGLSLHAALLLFTGLMLADAALHVWGAFALFPKKPAGPPPAAPRPDQPPQPHQPNQPNRMARLVRPMSPAYA